MKKTLLQHALFPAALLFTGSSLGACPDVNAAFTTSQTTICGPGPQVISFTNTSTGANNLTADYEWFLNGVPFDNTTGMGAPGTSSISAAGTYTYMLVATDPGVPCTDTAIVVVQILPTSNAGFNFNPNNQCAGLPVNFTNTSTGTVAGTTYLWNFGDGTTASTSNATHTFTAGGTYNVSLTQTNGPGCSNTEIQAVTALDIPAVSISGADGDGDLVNCLLPADPSTSEVVTFSNATVDGVSYTWNFGDGSPAFTTNSLADFTHTYTSYGTYTVTMTATHANGCTSTETLTVVFEKYVSAAMTLDITEYSGCAPHDLTTLINLSVNANQYTWNFGDGTTITTTSDIPPSHFYTAAGTYTISLTAVNSCNTANATISPIIIVDGPTANFNNSLGGAPGCAPQNVTFGNTSAGTSPANNYQWIMGNGNTYNNVINPPAQVYDTTGVYTVTLIAGNACGYDTITANITIDTIPVVDIVSNPLDGCSPLTVTTVNNSYGTPINYTWTVDGFFAGNMVNLPDQTFVNSGTSAPVNHTIQLTGSNHCGTDTDSETITVHPVTIAGVVISTDTICEGGSINFTSISTGENLTYDWDFGVSTEVTAGPHAVQFNAAGTYTVQLIVDGFCGPDTATVDVVVLPIPVADFTPGAFDACIGSAIPFVNNSTLGGTYNWTFGGGTPATSNVYAPAPVTFNTAGTQTVTLHVNVLGCTDSHTEDIVINPLPDPAFTLSATNGCTPLPVTFNYTGIPMAGDIYDWDLGNGNSSNIAAPPGETYIALASDSTYTVQLVVTSAAGCSDSSSINVVVHPLPVADYSPLPDTACAGTPIGFLNNSSGASTYAWDFGDGATSTAISPSHAYTLTGDIITQLIAYTAFGCTDTLTVPVYVDSIPTAGFNFDIVCEIDTTHFTDLSTGGVTDWLWTFGDGSAADTSPNPNHFYGNDGTFSVSLTVTNPAGCTHTVTQLVSVSTVPVANFTTGSTCLGSVSAFTDLSAGISSSWEWDFGDGTPVSNVQHPTHTYAATGTYNVQLIAMAGNGCSDTIVLPITVTPVPTADFTFASVCANDATQFTDLSTGAPDTYTWNFGDGTIDNTNTPDLSHVFVTSGTFNVTLTAGYAASGCTHSVTLPVDAYPNTTPDFSTNTPCLGGATAFTDLTGGTPDQWQWDFGDGSAQDNSQNPVHIYGAPGIYPIELVTENAFGCIDTFYSSVEVFPLPVADFSFTVVCLNSSSVFTDNSTDAVNWQWDFGDGSAGTGPNPSHTYLTAGNFDVQLVVTNVFGCTDTLIQTITVNPNPVSDFTATTACHTYPNFFTDGSTDAVLWTWDFGDGSAPDNNASPDYTYANPGTYTVSLLVENVFGCTHSSSQPVDVLIQPQADFTYTNVCAGETVQLTDLSTNAPTTFQWDFGDGSPLDFNQNPTHLFNPGGTYTVTYIVGNPAGCMDTLVTPVDVYTVPVPDFTADTVCLFSITSFTDLTFDPAPIDTWYYDFSDGNQSFSQHPTYIFQNPGIYDVTLTVTNIHGCDSSVTKPVLVADIPTAAFTADTVCTGNPTTFTDISTGLPSSWFWTFGDGNSSPVGPVVQHTYATPGTYIVSLLVSGGGGACSDQVFGLVEVSDNVQAGITAPDTTCDGNMVNFSDNSTITSGTIDTYFWDFGDGVTANTIDASHVYAGPGTYTVTHTVSTAGGCSSTTTITITITDAPAANFIEFSACQDGITAFEDLSTIGAGTIAEWLWDFGDGSTSALQDPTHVFTTDGNYNVTLTVTSDLNCSSTITLPVVVYPAPQADFTAPVGCPQDTIQYTDLSTVSSGSITNWEWDFTDGTTSSLQNPEHAFQILYDTFYVQLVVTSNFGCTDTVTRPVITHPIPDFDWTPNLTSGCEDFEVQFTDSSTVANGFVTNWEWSFGDGSMSFAQNPIHIFDDPGEYYVSLWVTTSNGCEFNSYVDYPIIVYPLPEAGFTPFFAEVSINEPEVQFTDLSSGAINWEWSFDDGDYSNEINPLHEFTDTGFFEIMQIVYSDFGCIDTAIHVHSRLRRILLLYPQCLYAERRC